MSNEAGFTLIETVVAAVVGVILVLAVGLLGGSIVHQRTSADSTSAALSLAEWQLEQLRALPSPQTAAALTAGTHGPTSVSASGISGGPFRITYVVIDGMSGISNLKDISVTVSHATNPMINAQLHTYYDVN